MARNRFFNIVAQLGGVAASATPALQARIGKGVETGRGIANQAAEALRESAQIARGQTGTGPAVHDPAAPGEASRAPGDTARTGSNTRSRLGLRMRVLADKAIGDSTRRAGELFGNAVQGGTKEARSLTSLARGFLRTGMHVWTQKLDPRLGPTNTILQQVLLEAERKGVLALSALAVAVKELGALQTLCAQEPDGDLTVQLEPVTALIAKAKAIVDKAPNSEAALSIRYAELDTALGDLADDVQIYPARLRTFADQFGPQNVLDLEIWRQLQDRFEALDLDCEAPGEESGEESGEERGEQLAQFCDLEADLEVALSLYRNELQRFDRDLQRLADLNRLYSIQIEEAMEQLEEHPDLKEPLSRVLRAVENKPVNLDDAEEALRELCSALNALA